MSLIHPVSARVLLAFVLCLLIGATRADGQVNARKELPVVTKTTAIRNARIVQAPGRVLERGTIVMREGRIVAVGRNVDIPYDAEIIDGDSLTVYAGFIDGLSYAGMPEVKEPERDARVNPAEPPNDVAGIQPERLARTVLLPDEPSIEKLRKIGFTAAHVVPRGGILPGTGSIVLLTGEDARSMVLRPDVSLYFTFEGGRGVYPNTPMGIMATMRQFAREADRRGRVEELYAANSTDIGRPIYDPVHEAFYPVISGERPIVALADGTDSALEARRALQLREELGFRLILAGVDQGFEIVDKLEGVPFFLTLGLPKIPKEDEASDSTATGEAPTEAGEMSEARARDFVRDHRTRSYQDVDEERNNLEARRSLQRERYVATASTLNKAGLRFGFTSLGVDVKDVRKNLREMITAGFPEDAALAALTIDAARLLDIDDVTGTIEAGKIGNLVVTRGSYFDPEAPVRYVFIEGRKFEIDSDEQKKKSDETAERL